MLNTERERFFDKVMPEPNTGCWYWMDYVQISGYGQFHSKIFPTKRAHRVAYLLFKGPIPEGMQLDHKCRVRCCVNPDHLEPVTGHENMRRGAHAQKTHCAQGHPFSEENTYYTKRGWRRCRACLLVRQRNRYKQKAQCKYGHPFSGSNVTIDSRGLRICITCRRSILLRTPGMVAKWS